MTTPRDPRMARRVMLAGLAGTGTAFVGCVRQAPPPVRRFYLTALDDPLAGVGSAGWSLVVQPPQTAPALRTNRIAQAIGPNEFDYYADAEWGDLAPLMFQTVLIRSFDRSGAIAVVANERQRLRPDFMLNSTLVPFFAAGALGTAPEARVGLDAQLIRHRGRELVATRSFEETRTAAAPDIAAVVAAFDAASRAVIAAVIPWTVAEGNAAGAGA